MNFETYKNSTEIFTQYLKEINDKYHPNYIEPILDKLGNILENRLPIIFQTHNISNNIEFIKCLTEIMAIYSQFFNSEFNLDPQIYVYETHVDRHLISCLNTEDIRIKTVILSSKIIQTEFLKWELNILPIYSNEMIGYLIF